MKHCKCTTAILTLLLLAITATTFAQDVWLPSFSGPALLPSPWESWNNNPSPSEVILITAPKNGPEANNGKEVFTMIIMAITGFAALLLLGILFFTFFCGKNNRENRSSISDCDNRLRADISGSD